MAQKQDRQALGLPISSGTTGIRTWDTRIFNPLLYQLSYSTAQERANICRFGRLRNTSKVEYELLVKGLSGCPVFWEEESKVSTEIGS